MIRPTVCGHRILRMCVRGGQGMQRRLRHVSLRLIEKTRHGLF